MVQVSIIRPKKIAAFPTKEELDKLSKQAINETINKTRTFIRREVQQELSIKTKVFTEQGKRQIIETRRPSSFQIQGEVRVIDKPLPFNRLKSVRQGKKGLSFIIKKSKGRKKLPKGFKANVGSVEGGFFIRKVRNGKRVARFPIRRLFTTTIRELIDNQSIQDRINNFVPKQLEKSYLRRLNRKKFKGLF